MQLMHQPALLLGTSLPLRRWQQGGCQFLKEKNCPDIFKYCPDQIIRRCVPEEEHRSVLIFCHELACSGHFDLRKTAEKVLQSGFYWPTLFKNSFTFASHA